MNSHALGLIVCLSASPLVGGERIEVRGSTTGIRSQNPHPTLSALHPVAILEEANIALTT
jgi:hypothetical protein